VVSLPCGGFDSWEGRGGPAVRARPNLGRHPALRTAPRAGGRPTLPGDAPLAGKDLPPRILRRRQRSGALTAAWRSDLLAAGGESAEAVLGRAAPRERAGPCSVAQARSNHMFGTEDIR